MQPYAINIDPVAASEFDAAVDAAILAQAASLADAVKAVIANLGEQTKLMAVDLTAPTHIGAYIAGTHASGDGDTALREQASVSIYSAPPPPPPAPVDTITQAPDPGAQPGGLLAPTPGGSPLIDPNAPVPADTGAVPIPTALEPANTVPDGSAPSAGTPPEQVSPSTPAEDEAAEAADEQAEADAAAAAAPAPSVPVVIAEPAPVEPPDAADQAIADAEAADAAEDAAQATPPAATPSSPADVPPPATPPEPQAGA